MCTIKVKGGALTDRRIKQGLSMNEICKNLKLNTGVLSRIESGKTSPRPATAKRICEALGCDFDEIFEIGGK